MSDKQNEIELELKKYKLTWSERVPDFDGGTSHFQEKIQIIEATSQDDACEKWEKENEFNEFVNGLDSCYEIVEHPLFDKFLMAEMPDGYTYAVPIEFIARNRAEAFASNYNNDETISLKEDTLPLFEKDESKILEWATSKISWKDAYKEAQVLQKKIPTEKLEELWKTTKHKIL